MSKSDRLQSVVIPILDFMQTIPAFVYLIPVIMLLGIGKAPALIAVCIYAMPPVIRLTDLGIRLVDKDVLEAADAFGASPTQKMFRVQLPLALPNLFAGVNQTIMMALAMVVVASLIGAQGLGSNVLKAVNNQYLTLGIMNGSAIVAIAIVFDRVSQKFGKRLQKHSEVDPWMTIASRLKTFTKSLDRMARSISRLVKDGMSKDELNAKHGHVLGLKDVNIHMPSAKIQVIMGLSGSGKSTMIRHINRLIEPTAGEVLYQGEDVCKMSTADLQQFRRHKTAMVFQKFALLPHRTVVENTLFGIELQGVDRDECQERGTSLAEAGLGWTGLRITTRTSCLAVCNSGLGWPVR